MQYPSFKLTPLAAVLGILLSFPAAAELTLAHTTDLQTPPANHDGHNGTIISKNGKVVVASVGKTTKTDDSTTAWHVPNLASSANGSPAKYTLAKHEADGSGYSLVFDTSDDGKVIVGRVGKYNTNGQPIYTKAMAWSDNNWATKTDLIPQTGSYAYAKAVSGDGKVIVGLYENNGKLTAIAWSGKNWQTTTPLEELVPNGVVSLSDVNAVNRDGTVIVGHSFSDTDLKAVAWSGKNWAIKNLGTLVTKNTGYSTASIVSDDGKVIAGEADRDTGEAIATVWYGDNWNNKKGLGTLGANNLGKSYVKAMSADGAVIVGRADDGRGGVVPDFKAVAWSGNNWTDTTNLGTLKKNDVSGNSYAIAISSDGKIIAGDADNDNGDTRAVVWHGDKWSKVIDLGTLKSDNSGESKTDSISGDGSIVAGYADNEKGDSVATLWHLKLGNKVNQANTIATINELNQHLGVVNTQHYQNLNRLNRHCYTDVRSDVCYGVQYHYTKAANGKQATGSDNDLQLSIGTLFTDNIAAGITVSRGMSANLPNTMRYLNHNTGYGGYLRFNSSDDRYYTELSTAIDKAKLGISRGGLSNTEKSYGEIGVQGRMTIAKIGVKKDKIHGYAGIKHASIIHDDYQETGIAFPVYYSQHKLKNTSLLMGVGMNIPITNNLSWVNNIYAEHDIKTTNNQQTATSDTQYLGKYSYTHHINKNRYSVRSGIAFKLSPNHSISFVPEYGKGLAGDNYWGFSLGYQGNF